MALWGRLTLSEAVTSVLQTMGLPVPNSIVGSDDAVTQQLIALATDVGQQLLSEGWQFLDKDFEIITTAATQYALPDDFDCFVPDSQWNYTSRMPVVGSLTEQEWQMLNARDMGGTTFVLMFRLVDDQIELYQPPLSQQIIMPYRSRGWVQPASGSPRDHVTSNDDLILYEPQLFKHCLKLAWYEAKQFDTTKLLKDKEKLLSAAKAKDSPGRTLSLNRSSDFPLLGYLNIPDTGYGGG